mmetsp:Transcript_25392/g.31643  ORF Transcript_25392/g.31643 Transcript_25392/m.31643 type:complete len:527 (+) Transcript_25392:41-1621(+)
MGNICGKGTKETKDGKTPVLKVGPEGESAPKQDNKKHLTTHLMRSRTQVDVYSVYDGEKMLGEGSMGAIRKVKKKSNGQYYALKTIQLSRISPAFVAELKNEIDLLRSLDHPNIIRALEVFESKRRINLIIELCGGGDLYTRHPYTEREATRIVLQITSAIAYLHDNGIVHRDLKFENVMFATKDKNSLVKLIDFGLSSKYRPGHALKGSVGTLYSMAPEVIQGNSDEASDNWSNGVMAFMLLSSQMPFFGKDERTVIMKIESCSYGFRGPRWKNVSDEAKDFVRKLLVLERSERYTAKKALAHPWLQHFSEEQGKAELPTPSSSSRSENRKKLDCDSSRGAMTEVVESMKKFGTYGKLKKAALMVVAHQCNCEQLSALIDAFGRFDKAKNGQISLSELKDALKETENPLTDTEIDQLFHDLDVDETGLIHYTEFIAATVEAMGNIEIEKLEEAFDRLDADDSGFITVENLKEILGEDYDDTTINQMIQEGDFKQNHKIDFEEFKKLMQEGASPELLKIENMKKEL